MKMTTNKPAGRRKVMMFVMNELIYDARVLKSATSLSEKYDVLLVGVWRRKFDFDQEAEQEAQMEESMAAGAAMAEDAGGSDPSAGSGN